MLKRLSLLFACLLLAAPAVAMDSAQQKEFEHIYMMGLDDLAELAEAKLEQTYPHEDWDRYNFPSFVHSSDPVEVAYMVAVKNPSLMGEVNVKDQQHVIPCYCFCSRMGHDNLLYCFWKNGVVGGGFDPHASECNVCVRQALLAFLWNDLGATHSDIIAGMESKFKRLIEMHERGEL